MFSNSRSAAALAAAGMAFAAPADKAPLFYETIAACGCCGPLAGAQRR